MNALEVPVYGCYREPAMQLKESLTGFNQNYAKLKSGQVDGLAKRDTKRLREQIDNSGYEVEIPRWKDLSSKQTKH